MNVVTAQAVAQNLSARGDYQLIPGDYPMKLEDQVQVQGQDNLVQDPMQPGAYVQRTCCQRMEEGMHQTWFQASEALLICANAAVIGMETDMTDFLYWNEVENGFLLVFLLELIFKICIIGPIRFFNWNDPEFTWNLFDASIVALGCFDAVMYYVAPGEGSGGFATIFRMIRLLRILRIFRIVKFLKELYVLAFGLVEAVKAVFWVTVLMFFVLYVCSIVLVKTVGNTPVTDKNYEFLIYRYGSIVDSMLTLFVLMSSPNFVIYQDEEGLLDAHPPFVIFLIMFITFGSFGMIALLTGVISESMFQKNEVRKEQIRIEQEEMKEVITSKCEMMFESIDIKCSTDGGHEVSVAKLQSKASDMCRMLQDCGIHFSRLDMERIIEFMDIDGTGMIGIDEFVRTMLKVADGLSPMSVQEIQNRVGVVERKVDTIQKSVDEGMASMTNKMDAIQRQLDDMTKALRLR